MPFRIARLVPALGVATLAAVALTVVACGGRSSRNDLATGSGDSLSTTAGTASTPGGSTGLGGGGAGGSSSGNSNAGSSTTGGVGETTGSSGSPAGGASSGASGMASSAGSSGQAGGGEAGNSNEAGRGGGGEAADPIPTLTPCDASAQTGCESGSFCQGFGTCDPATESGCEGYCAKPLERSCDGDVGCPEGYACVALPDSAGSSGTTCVEASAVCETNEDCPSGFACVSDGESSRCSPDRVSCSAAIACDETAVPCTPGFIRSTPDGCYGPCIRVEHCACTNDYDCGAQPAVCNHATGICAIPKAPAPTCLVQNPEPMCGNPESTYYSFTDGHCEAVTGLRCGGYNEFLTLEECQAFCEGKPFEEPCAAGFIHATVCLTCGPFGGCGAWRELCAPVCGAGMDCPVGEGTCVDGVCTVQGCF